MIRFFVRFKYLFVVVLFCNVVVVGYFNLLVSWKIKLMKIKVRKNVDRRLELVEILDMVV